MSSMGELTFFLGLQVKQKPNGIFISQDKYVAEILKKFDFASVKTASTPIETQKPLVKDEEASDVDAHLYRFQVTPKTSHLSAVKRIFRYLKGKPKLGLWYPRESSFDLESYSDSDYAGANLDRKSTTGGCQFLGRRLITWQCKKQTIVATSTTEAEYVAAASCCGQVLWIQNQMLDYGFNFMNTKIYIDNESTICIVKNPVYHSKTKHIAIRHHFIRDAYEKKLIQVLNTPDDNVSDLLTRHLMLAGFSLLLFNWMDKSNKLTWFKGRQYERVICMKRGKTHHGKSNLFQETPTTLCSTFLPIKIEPPSSKQNKLKSWPLFKSKKIAQVVRAWIQSKNSLVKHFEDMRLCRPSKEYLQVKLVSMVDDERRSRRFRESLRRVTDGAEAFLILTLFILCLDKVSTDQKPKLVTKLGKVCYPKETLRKIPPRYKV
ncbi:putative ribonuclease H-like domain-containing protein [Tanacetum coccineum]